jgi:hypothetical protein
MFLTLTSWPDEPESASESDKEEEDDDTTRRLRLRILFLPAGAAFIVGAIRIHAGGEGGR